MENLNVMGKIQKRTTFSHPIEEEVTKIVKDGNESVVYLTK